MTTVGLMIATAVGYLIAYHTYGKWIARRVFCISDDNTTPAHEMEDGEDYCPAGKEVLFGHHFTSIAGTGPIVGPAVAVIWGWLPAVLWVFLGSILMGAVHDMGAVVISARNKGRSIGDLSQGLVNSRVQILFLIIILLVLFVLIAVFALVVGILFKFYPQAVLPVWLELPIAVAMGWLIYGKKAKALMPSLIALGLLYLFVILGAYLPISLPEAGLLGRGAIFDWVIILLVYSFIASVLPVWTLLQPRDYINGHQLLVAMSLLVVGVIVAQPTIVAPAVNLHPEGAPVFWPFLFITIACGAVSGFHSLVGSGTTSKQLNKERDAQFIGYGSMLMESFLAILVIIACVAGIGMGFESSGTTLTGAEAWNAHYGSWKQVPGGLGAKLTAFVTGSANMIATLGIPKKICLAIIGVLIASFAGTSMDTATRLQRYVVTELMKRGGMGKIANKYVATALAVVPAGFLALHDGKGLGGLTLWPIFGTLNQLIAGLALLVITVYLAQRTRSFWITLFPMLFLLIVTAFAMYHNLSDWMTKAGETGLIKWKALTGLGFLIVFLEIWIVAESFNVLVKLRKSPPKEEESIAAAPA